MLFICCPTSRESGEILHLPKGNLSSLSLLGYLKSVVLSVLLGT